MSANYIVQVASIHSHCIAEIPMALYNNEPADLGVHIFAVLLNLR